MVEVFHGEEFSLFLILTAIGALADQGFFKKGITENVSYNINVLQN